VTGCIFQYVAYHGRVDTFERVFQLWPTVADFARAIDEQRGTVQQWRNRGRIPSEYWVKVRDATALTGHAISIDELAAAEAETFLRSRETQA